MSGLYLKFPGFVKLVGPMLWIIPYITLMGVYSDGCWINEIESISYLYVFPQLVLVLVKQTINRVVSFIRLGIFNVL